MKLIDPQTIRLPPEQVKRHTGAKFRELVESVKLHGLLQPPVLTEIGKDYSNGFVFDCLAGTGRVMAWLEARPGEPMPAIFRRASDHDLALTAVENLVRVDYETHETFDILTALVQQGKSQKDIARLLSMDPGQVSRYLSVARLIPAAMEQFRAGRLTLSVANQIAQLDAEQQHLALEAARNGATREELRQAAKRGGKSKPQMPPDKIQRLSFTLRDGTKITLTREKESFDVPGALKAAEEAVELLKWAEGECLSAKVASKAIGERARKPPEEKKGKASAERARAGG
jgi:ParB-like chromosome segregation protein Spo0J